MCYLYQSAWVCMSCLDVASHYLHTHQCFSWLIQLQLVQHIYLEHIHHYILNKLKMTILNLEK
jgi:hypothetical protein